MVLDHLKIYLMTNKELLDFFTSANKCKDLDSLAEYHSTITHIHHPNVYHTLGEKYFNLGDLDIARELFTKGAQFGLEYPIDYYNKPNIDSIGQCLAFLVTRYQLLSADRSSVDENSFYNATCLAYIYLSKAIDLHEHLAYDSFRTRANLLRHNKSFSTVFSIIRSAFNHNLAKEPFIISDYYSAYCIPQNPYSANDFNSARIVHNYLDDVSISGKAANEYNLEEIVEIGKIRHQQFYDALKRRFLSGEFYMKDIVVV